MPAPLAHLDPGTDAPPAAEQRIPEWLRAGTPFAFRSRGGTQYRLTFLHQSHPGASLVVRREDGSLARLDARRVLWDTCRASGTACPIIQPGDELLVEVPSRSYAGVIEEPAGDELALRLDDGSRIELPRACVVRLELLFRARELETGDVVRLRSRSGMNYAGRVAAAPCTGCLPLVVDSGRRVTLRCRFIDPAGTRVLVPIPIDLLRSITPQASSADG